MNRVIVFDNAPNCCKMNTQNGVLVDDFTGVCNPDDRTLYSVFRIVQFIIAHTPTGHTVPSMLRHMTDKLSTENPISGFPEEFIGHVMEVQYALPKEWAHVVIEQVDPICVPPHGRFFRVPASTKR